MNTSDKIYVAGHRGLVGSALMRRLETEGYENIIVRTSKELDLRRQVEVENFFQAERPDYVFLAAAKVGGILANSTYQAEFIYDNLMIASNVIASAYKFDARKLLNLGSSCIYPKNAPQPMKEEYLLSGPLEPTNEPYAIAKIAAIKLCRYYNEQYGTDFISVMPTNLYGPEDNFNLETAHVLPALIRKFHLAKLLSQQKYEEIRSDLNNFPVGYNLATENNIDKILAHVGISSDSVSLWGTGNPFREFLYVYDLAEACLFLMREYSESEIINIGTGEDISIKDLADTVKAIVGYDGRVEWDDTKPDGTPRKLLNIEKITALGWKPKINLLKGIEQTYLNYMGNQEGRTSGK